jgi:hypothetical protein
MSATMDVIDLPGPAPVPHALLDRLADEVQSVCPQPIDVLQVAALLETAGITDRSAVQRYGHASVFDLAASVVRHMAPPSAKPRASASDLAAPESRWQAAMDYLRGPLTLLPMVLLSVVIMVYQSYGQWSSAQVLAFSLSVVGSLLVTSGFVQAASRKGSSYLSQGYVVAARRIVGIVLAIGLATVCITAAMLVIAALRFLAAPPDTVIIMGISYLVLSCLWLAAGVLFLLGQVVWFGIGLAVGVGLIVAVLRGLAPLVGQPPWAMLAATVIGSGGALLVMAVVTWRTLERRSAASPVSGHRVVLPATPHLVTNLAPYFAYGVLYVVLVLSGHISGWLGATPPGADRMTAVTATEVGLTIALGGIILAGGVAERTIARFWRLVKVYQVETSPAQPAAFSCCIRAFFRRECLRYCGVLALCSAFVVGGVVLLMAWLQAHGALVLPWTVETQIILAMGVVGYGVMALGIFHCMFMITLSRPAMATHAVVVGILVTLVVGLIAGRWLLYPFSALGVVVGSVVFALAARQNLQRIMRHTDYYYYASF